MNATRRRFFGFLGTAPLAARAAAEKTASDISGVWLNPPGYGQGTPASQAQLPPDQIRSALLNLRTKRMVEEILYEEERNISRIDPDLAVLRSFSLNAKVTFQRQRNVEWRLRNMQSGWTWDRIDRLLKKAVGLSWQQ